VIKPPIIKTPVDDTREALLVATCNFIHEEKKVNKRNEYLMSL
jgi:hypothetical protein